MLQPKGDATKNYRFMKMWEAFLRYFGDTITNTLRLTGLTVMEWFLFYVIMIRGFRESEVSSLTV